MAYKTIVVQFEREADVQGPLLKAAAALAQAQGAHLTGIAVLPSYYKVPPEAAGALVPMDVVREDSRQAGLRMKAVFEARLRTSAITHEWRMIDPGFLDTTQAVAGVAHTADLIIASQDLHGELDGYRDGQGLLAVLTGRPVLLIPAGRTVHVPAERVVVAWDGSRPSARALFDALPLMMPPTEVTLLSMRTSQSFDGPEFIARTEQNNDLTSTLARHGVTCRIAVEIAKDAGIARAILSYAAAHEAGMLVVGGYGHSRLREWVFGGVTRTLLRVSPVPLMLSH